MASLSRVPLPRIAYFTLGAVATIALSPILAVITAGAPEVSWLFESLAEGQTAPGVTPFLQVIGCAALCRIAVAAR